MISEISEGRRVKPPSEIFRPGNLLPYTLPVISRKYALFLGQCRSSSMYVASLWWQGCNAADSQTVILNVYTSGGLTANSRGGHIGSSSPHFSDVAEYESVAEMSIKQVAKICTCRPSKLRKSTIQQFSAGSRFRSTRIQNYFLKRNQFWIQK